ncbi:hypothetical protein M378DRAFT_82541 [Amanita muscaria Koide BX008]|uniref:Uncharacterized protein n=1 Tax=Amanita muscaria (strain Koide BX008) TaxID=946122 RepID=A0A0C2WYJ8_AMAMK|nr:hypothetical protein M378DRAFT_82541 [Amanita muscaria Koide BX008]
MLTLSQRLIVTAIAEALLYGIYVATFIRCLRWLIFTDEGWKLRGKIPGPSLTMTFATIFFFLASTTNLITSLQYLLGFLRNDEKFENWYMREIGMANYLSSCGLILPTTRKIYRCWMVHARLWRNICIPVTFWLGLLACSALSFYYQGKGQHRQKIATESITVAYVCNIATTIYTTTAIIYRIWCTTKASGSSPKRLTYIMRILAESGILYTSTSALSLVGSVLVIKKDPTWVENLINDIAAVIVGLSFPMAGIALNVLLIRVNLGRVELRDSQVNSSNVNGERNLSENNAKGTASSEVLSSNPPDEVNDGIQELRM